MLKTTLKIGAVLAISIMSASAAVKIDKINFMGWPNSYRISNGTVEAVVTGDVGPRVIRFGFVGGQNLFKEFTEQLGKSGEKDWQARGGHRVWFGPEDRIKTYAPDNGPVHIEIHGGVLEATEPVEPLTGLEKKITIRMAATGSAVEVVHQLRNAGKEPFHLAPWCLTMFAQGGTGIHGLPERGQYPEKLLATGPLVLWAYTNLVDPRLKLLQKYIVLHQDPGNSAAQKIGSFNHDTWGAYLLNGDLFIKKAQAKADPTAYPDYGCSFETFTNADFLELETLGPMVDLKPGESVAQTEHWTLHKGVHLTQWNDAELDRVLAPLVK
jgi:hypothetical protein